MVQKLIQVYIYITYFKLHESMPEIKEVQEMILKYSQDRECSLIGAIMFKELVKQK